MLLLKCRTQYASKFGNLAVATGLEKVSFHSNPKKGNPKECSNYYCTTALISHSSKVMLKIIQNRLQQYMNHELPDVQGGLEKTEESEVKLPTSTGSLKKQESSRKTSTSALLTMPKPLTMWITTNYGKFIKRLFSSSSLSAVRVLSVYLWILIFLPAILIPACASSSLAFHMM